MVPFDLFVPKKSEKDTGYTVQYYVSLPSDSALGHFPISSNHHRPTWPIHRTRGSSRNPIRRYWLPSSRPDLCRDDREVLGRLTLLGVLSCIHSQASDHQQPRTYSAHQRHDLLDLRCGRRLRSTVRMASRAHQIVEQPGLIHMVHLLISIREQMILTAGREFVGF